jgi:hypothetical protein
LATATATAKEAEAETEAGMPVAAVVTNLRDRWRRFSR